MKKTLSLALAMVFILGMCSSVAFAQSDNPITLVVVQKYGSDERDALVQQLVYDAGYICYAALRDRTLAGLWGRLAGLRAWRTVRSSLPAGRRQPVKLQPATRGWLNALRMHLAYRRHGGRGR